MEQPISRRAWLAALASGTGALAAACQPSGATEVDTPEGKVLQWQDENILVLVTGYQPSYRQGEAIRVNVLVNNQTQGLVQARVRTRLIGRGEQVANEAEVAILTVKPEDATNADREIPIARNLPTGDYTLSVEIPPYRLDGRETGRGTTLRTPVQILAAG